MNKIAKVGSKNEPEVAPASSAREELQRIIDIYKVKNPVKYERKKESLAKQLAAL